MRRYKIKKRVKSVLFLVIAVLFGWFLGIIWDPIVRWKMVNVYSENKDYSLILSFKDPRLLVINRAEEIQDIVDKSMDNLVIDLMAPPALKKVFEDINRKRMEEKARILKELLDRVKEERGKKKETEI